jgi:hypothetical protein|tara:strand:- start:1358 stop:1528 length:171 start_codon:yes stop_codon:yes gene_type:complete
MTYKIQKWYKLKEFNNVWIPCEENTTFGDVNNYDFYYTPEGKHPFEIIKLGQEIYK